LSGNRLPTVKISLIPVLSNPFVFLPTCRRYVLAVEALLVYQMRSCKETHIVRGRHDVLCGKGRFADATAWSPASADSHDGLKQVGNSVFSFDSQFLGSSTTRDSCNLLLGFNELLSTLCGLNLLSSFERWWGLSPSLVGLASDRAKWIRICRDTFDTANYIEALGYRSLRSLTELASPWAPPRFKL